MTLYVLCVALMFWVLVYFSIPLIQPLHWPTYVAFSLNGKVSFAWQNHVSHVQVRPLLSMLEHAQRKATILHYSVIPCMDALGFLRFL